MINDLVASTLWHRLVCMEPPSGLIKKLQAILVDFFWDRLHWVPQAVLFLPKEEGGQGLVHIESRVATFRVQFIQKYLTTACKYLVWKDVASTILRRVNGLGIDAALFFMDVNFLNLSELSPKGFLKLEIFLNEKCLSLLFLCTGCWKNLFLVGLGWTYRTAQHQASPTHCVALE